MLAKRRLWLTALARLPMATGMRPTHLQRTVKMSPPGPFCAVFLPSLAVCLESILNARLNIIECPGFCTSPVSSQIAGVAREWVKAEVRS